MEWAEQSAHQTSVSEVKVRTENRHFILKAEWPHSRAVSPSQAELSYRACWVFPSCHRMYSPGQAWPLVGTWLPPHGFLFSHFIQAQLKAQEEERQKKDAEEKQAQLERKREEKRLKKMVSSLCGVCRQLSLLGLTASDLVAPSTHLCAGHRGT